MAEPTDKDTRGATNLRIKFRSANLDEFIERYSVDVSRGGIFIRTREPLSVGSRLKLDFQLLEAGPLLEGEGTVVWIRQPDPARAEVTPGMGVRFDKLTPDSQARLDKILSEKERLSQSGKAPGLTKSAGGMAVRRPTGAFATVDAGAAKPAAPSAPPAAPPTPAPGEPATAASALSAPRMTAPLATQSRPSSPPATGFGRPRTTSSGMSPLRSAPAPSALFEAPTADDIDRALAVLEEKGPGPGPLTPPTPPPPVPTPPPRTAGDVPIHVADDASNEPTRVVSDPQEFAAHEAVTGKAEAAVLPETGVPELSASAIDDLTAPASADDEATMAASPAAFAAAERAIVGAAPTTERKTPAASLDAPLAAHLGKASPPPPPASPVPMKGPLRKKSIIVEPLPPTESGRFRTNAVYRRPSKAGKRVAVLLVLAAVGGAGIKFRHRLRAMFPASQVAIAPAPTPPPVPEPSPSAAPEAGVNTTAVDAAIAAATAGTAGSSGAMPAAPKEDQEKPALAGGPAPAAPSDENRPRRKRPRAPAAEKPAGTAAEKPAGTPEEKPQDKEDKKPTEAAVPGGDAPAPPSAPEPPPPPVPALKITSTPTGAEVIIDGSSVGTTPFSSKDLDPAVTHAIAVKKDGYETNVRTVGASDWAHPKSGPLLKMNVKLRRTAGETPKEPAEPKKPDVEIITPD